MYTFIPEPYFGPADNEIWYTTTDGSIISPNLYDVCDNTYENGQGVITCNGPITHIK
jgi:hypothetical protein